MILSPLKFLTLIVVLCIPGLAASTGKVADDPLLNLSIEELMQITVVTASRQSQKLNQVPSAVFVITGEDIRRSGATSIPEA
ncbi:MAG: TonB-dependent receptor, partial [Nitrosomonas sp.]|nr:TonB-dependent receptor [Nitrosomonas sp.]